MQRSRSLVDHVQKHKVEDSYAGSAWNQPCSQDHVLLCISEKIANWKEIAPYLGLKDIDVASITGCDLSPRSQSFTMLKIWRQRLGNAATYKELAAVFVQCGRQDLVDCVGDLLPTVTRESLSNNRIICINKPG